MAEMGRRSAANIVFIILLAAAVAGGLVATYNMFTGVMAGV
jgi:hypothetical protein